jgi:hypothetical protein
MESLLFDTNRFSPRKMRLVSIEACRRIAHLLPPVNYLPVIEWVDRYTDRLTDPGRWLDIAQHLATDVPERLPAATASALAAFASLRPDDAPDAATLQVVDARGYEAMVLAGCISPSLTQGRAAQVLQDPQNPSANEVFNRACETEELAIANLVREVFGNPFRPVKVDPVWLAWQDGMLGKLAQGIYEERAFDRLPILADALLDAGCDNEELIQHCRREGGHIRGCWALDLLAGRE